MALLKFFFIFMFALIQAQSLPLDSMQTQDSTTESSPILSTRSLMVIILNSDGQPVPKISIQANELRDLISDSDGIIEFEIKDTNQLEVLSTLPEIEFQQSLFELEPDADFTQINLLIKDKNKPIDTTKADLVVVAQREALHSRKEVSLKTVTQEEMREVSSTMGDPLRVISTLPGVTSSSDLNVRPFVRGGDEKETRVFWNKIPLIQPYHALSAFSIFNMETIEHIKFYSGGFPVDGNGSLSGALFMESKPAPLDSIEIMIHASLLRGNAYYGMPIINNKLGFYVAYQALLYDWVIKRGMDLTRLFMDDTEEIDKYQKFIDLPNFKDLELGLSYQINPELRIDYTLLRALDLFRILDPSEAVTGFSEGGIEQTISTIDTAALIEIPNWVHGINLNWVVNANWIIENTFAFQNQIWHVKFEDTSDNPLYEMDRSSLNYRIQNLYQLNDKHLLNFGLSYDYKFQEYDVYVPKFLYELLVQGNPDIMSYVGYFNPEGLVITTSSFFQSIQDYADQIIMNYDGKRNQHYLAAFISDVYTLNSSLKFDYGFRLEYENRSNEAFLAPRFTLYKSIDAQNEISISAGLYSQNEYEFHYRHFNPNLKAEKAWHLNTEWSHDFNSYYGIELSTYGKYYYDLTSIRLKETNDLNSGLFWDAIDFFTDINSDSLRAVIADSLGVDYWELEDNIEKYVDQSLNYLPPDLQQLVRGNIYKKRLDYSNSGIGYAIGTELTFKYDPTKKWRGWASVELSQSKRKDQDSGIWYNFAEHRPWHIKWHNYFDLPNDYEIALKLNVSAGKAYTGFTDFRWIADDNDQASDTLFVIEEKNNRRYGPYTRFDIRLSHTGTLFGHPYTSFFEIWNAMNEPNFILHDNETYLFKGVELNIPFPIFFLGYEMRW